MTCVFVYVHKFTRLERMAYVAIQTYKHSVMFTFALSAANIFESSKPRVLFVPARSHLEFATNT